MLNKLLIWLKFLGFPSKNKCLIRKINLSDIYSDIIKAQSWLAPDMYSENEVFVKNYMETLPVWNDFLSSLKAGDELWYYRFPKEMWQKMRGSHGYLILRNGRYYSCFELAKN